MKTRNLLNMAVLTLAIASCGSKSGIDSTLSKIQEDAGKSLEKELEKKANEIKNDVEAAKNLNKEIEDLKKKAATATGEEKAKLEAEIAKKEAEKKKLEEKLKKQQEELAGLKEENDLLTKIRDPKDTEYKKLVFVSSQDRDNKGKLRNYMTVETKDGKHEYTFFSKENGEGVKFTDDDFDLKNGNRTKVITTTKTAVLGGGVRATFENKTSMRKGGNEVRLSYSDFGSFEGIVKYLKIESNDPKDKAYEGREGKTGAFFAQGVEKLKANVAGKMTFTGKTFAFMKSRIGNNESEDFKDGKVTLDVNDLNIGKLNLNFGSELDLTVKNLNLSSQTHFNGFSDKVEAKGSMIKNDFGVNNTELNLNMYGPKVDKPTEAVGTYGFSFQKQNNCQSNCGQQDGLELKGSFGAKKE